jgi:hypothetical protein
MKFFTPELFVRFNSADDVGDRADEEWEAAVRAYHKHLDGVGDKLPEARTCTSCCFHHSSAPLRLKDQRRKRYVS